MAHSDIHFYHTARVDITFWCTFLLHCYSRCHILMYISIILLQWMSHSGVHFYQYNTCCWTSVSIDVTFWCTFLSQWLLDQCFHRWRILMYISIILLQLISHSDVHFYHTATVDVTFWCTFLSQWLLDQCFHRWHILMYISISITLVAGPVFP